MWRGHSCLSPWASAGGPPKCRETHASRAGLPAFGGGFSMLPRRDSSRRFSDPVRNTAKADRRCLENSHLPSNPGEDGGRLQKVVPIEHPQPDLQALAETEQSATSPAPQRGRIQRPGGILAMRGGPVPIAASADCLPGLMPAVQRVVTIGGRPTGQNGEGLATQSAEPPAHPDPILLFVMRLLAPLPMADDRCLPTLRAPAWHLPQIDPRHPGTGLSSDSGSAIERITQV
jgi:hypothetical protein